MTNPMWEAWASSLALGLGAFLSVICSVQFSDADDARLRRYVWWTTGICLTAIVLCYGMYFLLRNVVGIDELGNHIWAGFFIIAMTSLCMALTFAAMRNQQASNLIFWAVVAVAVVAVAMLLLLFFYPPSREILNYF